jgi:hypothetical protein
MTIAQEIANYDETNYPGIPPANPASSSSLDPAGAASAACNAKVPASLGPATLTVDSSSGFSFGSTVLIDTNWDPVTGKNDLKLQESQVITAIPDGTHITVQKLDKAHDGTTNPFPVVQRGEKGLLIAEWFEYTPTSGTDIAVTSNLASIA